MTNLIKEHIIYRTVEHLIFWLSNPTLNDDYADLCANDFVRQYIENEGLEISEEQINNIIDEAVRIYKEL